MKQSKSMWVPARYLACSVGLALMLLVANIEAADYYWTGAGTPTPHNNRDWFTPGNWALDSAGSGVIPTNGPGAGDNVFLINSTAYLGGYFVSPDSAPVTTQQINHLTIVSGSNNIGSRYTTGSVDLIVNGNFEILAGSFYGGPYSPNWMQFKGGFKAAQGTTLGNNSSFSDGGYWDLSAATSIELNGVHLKHMTNNWMYGPQVWNFGAEGNTVAIQIANNNTFNLTQDVVTAPLANIDSRGAQMLTIYNQITGTGGITKTGDATLVLKQASSNYNGATTISEGVLVADGGNAIGDTSAVVLGNFQGSVNGGLVKATLVLEADETVGSLAGGGTNGGNVILNGHTFTVGGNNSSTEFHGIIGGSATGATQGVRENQGSIPVYSPLAPVGYLYSPNPVAGDGNLVKTGSGILKLTGANVYTGTTTIRQGTVVVTNEVKMDQAGPLGQAGSDIIWGDATTPSSANNDTGNVTLIVENTTGSTVNWVFERGLDGSGIAANLTGRPRFLFNSSHAADTSTLTLTGDVRLGTGTTARYEFAAQRAGMLLDITGRIHGSGSTMLWNGSNLGTGTIRLSHAANDYNMVNKVLRGTLIVAGNVLATGPSPIGRGGLELGADGAPLAVNIAGGINTKPGFFMETAGTVFERNINLGSVATYATGGVNNNGVPNGYRIGGLNTSGKVTFSGNITSASLTNGMTNLALFAEGGGVVEFSGVINDNAHASNVTRVNINQFVNHADLNATDGGADQAVGSISTGTVILSGANTYQGGTTVRGGTLLANNTTGSATGTGDVTVLAGARLGGAGSINGSSSASITLSNGSHLMVGNRHAAGGLAEMLVLGNRAGAENVNMNLNGTMQFDITGAGSLDIIGDASYNLPGLGNDWLEINSTGVVDLTGGRVELAAFDTSSWMDGHTWKLIDWSHVDYNNITTSDFYLSTNQIGDYTLSQTFASDGYYVTATLVPEPTKGLLLICGAGIWLLRRRR